MGGTAPAGRLTLLLAATVVAAVGFAGLGLLALGPVHPALAAGLLAALAVLGLRSVRVGVVAEIGLADLPVLAGVLLLPLAAIAPLAALARVASDLVLRRATRQIVRNAASVAVSSGLASAVFSALEALPGTDGVTSTLIAAVAAVLTYVLADAGQVSLLLRAMQAPAGTWLATGGALRTLHVQLVWCAGCALTVEVARLQPLFLVPVLPLLYLGYLSIRARFQAERRARVLATLVEVSQAVGSSLDPTEVFRAVYKSVRGSLESDAFFVALVSPDGGSIHYRFLVDQTEEMAGESRPKAGTLAGLCVDQDRAILMRDAIRDYEAIGLERRGWGTVSERSIMVAPLRIRGTAVGAISAQSVHANAYDEGDLELLGAIANEAAVAIERADLYERTAALSRRLVELHRIGLELGAERELRPLARRLTESMTRIVGSRSVAVYLDNGAGAVEFVAANGRETSDVKVLPLEAPLIAAAIANGSVHIADSATLDEAARKTMEERGHRAVLIQPIRATNAVLGVLFVAWAEPHELTADERQLIDLLGGIGASAIRSLRLYAELDDAYLATVQTLMTTIQARDGYREDHQRRVADDADALGARLGLPETSLRHLRYASLFHSLGKIAVPPSILSKQGPLTSEERRVVREHPILGARIIESIRFLRGVVPIVLHANERWDGSGYPDGLAFEAIPYEARLLQIVLTYHTMLADRPYRRGLEPRVALGELRLLAGTRYDPGLVDRFVAMIEERGGVESAHAEVQESTRELAILAEITPQFNTLLDLKQLLDRVGRTLGRHWSDAAVHVLLRDEHTEELVVRAVAGMDGDFVPGVRLSRGQGLASWVLEHREPLNVQDVRLDPRARIKDDAARSRMLVPLINEARAIGVLAVSSERVGAFTPRDLTLLQAVGAQIAAAIEVSELHERLKRAANTDGLTGLHNFRYFYDRLEEELARAERRGASVSVAYFDIDELKAVNDRHGHLAGDAVLRALGGTIGDQVRTEDVPARYGGDEFAIVMPDTGRDEAEKVVVRLMEVLDTVKIDLGEGRTLPMPNRSWGVASFPADGTTAKELVEFADGRAYERKRAKS